VVTVASERRSFAIDRLFETLSSAGVSAASQVEIGVTQYVRSGYGDVAFQVLSAGAVDILVVNESVMPIEALHDNAYTSSYLGRLAAWGRVIVFDRRGVGMSDAVAADTQLALGDWVGDAMAVLDAVGSSQAAVFSSGPSAGLIALQLAAEHPDRISFLSVYDAIARYRWAPDYPWGVSSELEQEIGQRMRAGWGTRFADRRGRFAATAARHPGFVDWALTWFRRGVGPATHTAHAEVLRASDVRAALSSISCPTMVINHADVDDGRYLADHIADARYIEVHDPCHLLFSEELDHVMAATGELFNGNPLEPARRRVLTTLLFTDIVGSTASVDAIGDRRWGLELDVHYDMVRRQIERFDGQEIKTTGDGFIATFDGPTRAVQCALAIRHDAAASGLSVRAGVHTGEVELRGGDVLGVNVHVAQRICALAASDQVVVSKCVIDLVTGSELRFGHLGDHPLKGLPGRWSVYEASPSPQPLREVSPGASVATLVNGRVDDLSPREREVLAAVATGASNADIASSLFISEATVKAHISHLFVKVGCTNRVQLALHARDRPVAS
jgi:class 3 adenylate cyclase/DNA-binding CsgD family transcriptional regulator